MRNWIESTNLAGGLNETVRDIEEKRLRKLLFRYIADYQEIYYFDLLDEVFAYLEITIIEESDDLADNRGRIQELIDEGMEEYCFSLNEISEALNRIFSPDPITVECTMNVLNHVLEAYSCNEEPEIFLSREIETLSAIFAIKN